MQDYHDVVVWQKSFVFVKEIYAASNIFPKCEIWGITNQLRRAAVSVSANIAEGRGKSTDRDFLKFLYIAKGSLNECQFYIELAAALQYIDEDVAKELENKRGEVGYLLYRLIYSLEKPKSKKTFLFSIMFTVIISSLLGILSLSGLY